jgi:hypothetical protein
VGVVWLKMMVPKIKLTHLLESKQCDTLSYMAIKDNCFFLTFFNQIGEVLEKGQEYPKPAIVYKEFDDSGRIKTCV